MQLMLRDLTWETTEYITEKLVVSNNKFYETASTDRTSITSVLVEMHDAFCSLNPATKLNRFGAVHWKYQIHLLRGSL